MMNVSRNWKDFWAITLVVYLAALMGYGYGVLLGYQIWGR